MKESGKRYIGLDVHKHYLIAIGVDDQLNVVLPVRRVEFSYLEAWMKKTLTKQDSVVLEMTTNTWQLYDELSTYAGSVLVVHPPHVALILSTAQSPRRPALFAPASVAGVHALLGSGSLLRNYRLFFERVEIMVLAYVLVFTSDTQASFRKQLAILCCAKRSRFQSCHGIIPDERFNFRA